MDEMQTSEPKPGGTRRRWNPQVLCFWVLLVASSIWIVRSDWNIVRAIFVAPAISILWVCASVPIALGALRDMQHRSVFENMNSISVAIVVTLFAVFMYYPIALLAIILFGLPLHAFLNWTGYTGPMPYILAGCAGGACFASIFGITPTNISGFRLFWLALLKNEGHTRTKFCFLLSGPITALAFWYLMQPNLPRSAIDVQ